MIAQSTIDATILLVCLTLVCLWLDRPHISRRDRKD
jgi:hypothetical protein